METNIFSKEWKTLKMLNIWVNIKECFLSYFLLNYVCVVKAIIKLSYGVYIGYKCNVYANHHRKWK